MPFSITGFGPTGPLTATRISAASAVVLGARWETGGIRQVTIRVDGHRPESVEAFRRRHFFAGMPIGR